jgi:hypothetical protein
MKDHKKPRTWTDSLDKQSKRKKMDMRFGTWNVRRMYRAGSLMTVAEEISKYVTFSRSTGGQMGQRWHQTNKQIHIFLSKGERES